MKKIIVPALAVFFLGFASVSSAIGPQKQCHSKPHPGMKIFVLVKLLELTDEQIEAIKAIKKQALANNRPDFDSMPNFDMLPDFDMQQARNAPVPDPTDPNYKQKVNAMAKRLAAKLKAKIMLQAKVRAQIFAVLTPEQQAKLVSLRKEMREKMQQLRKHPPALTM